MIALRRVMAKEKRMGLQTNSEINIKAKQMLSTKKENKSKIKVVHSNKKLNKIELERQAFIMKKKAELVNYLNN